jgi:hypothetical protein
LALSQIESAKGRGGNSGIVIALRVSCPLCGQQIHALASFARAPEFGAEAVFIASAQGGKKPEAQTSPSNSSQMMQIITPV